MSSLNIRAGPKALEVLRSQAFEPDRVSLLLGASGGPKMLVLHGLDRFLSKFLRRRQTPLHLLGSSSGAWRFCCYGQGDPGAALERLTELYIEQAYMDRSAESVSRQARWMLEQLLGPSGVDEILTHPHFRTHISVTRSHLLGRSDRLIVGGLLLAATCNAVSRRTLAGVFSRALFHHPTAPPPLEFGDLATARIAMTARNFVEAALATASIPYYLQGVVNPPDTLAGVYRDGGLVDYHFALPTRGDGLVLQPHFFRQLVPGWFDRPLPWRRNAHTDRLVLLYPSPEWVARLPHGKIPTRHDFFRMEPDQRRRYWKTVVAESQRLGDELAELISEQRLAERCQPFRG